MWRWSIVLFCFINLFAALNAALLNVSDNPFLTEMSNDPNLSEVFGIIERSPFHFYFGNASGATLFAPQNMAFQTTGSRSNLIKDDTLLQYHMLNIPLQVKELTPEVTSVQTGNAPLFITRTEKGDVYVNNAKILQNLTKVSNWPNSSKRKVMHVIDEVILPLRSDNSVAFNPTAYGLLERWDEYDLGGNKLSKFAQRVRECNKSDVFRTQSPSTFFIPVDTDRNTFDPRRIDAKIIDGHVIFGKALFLNPTPAGQVFTTGAFTDSIKVVASFQPAIFNNATKKRHWYISSNTVVGDQTYLPGTVLSEIVYPNIPVKNGVVHLIQKPLMLIEKTVQQYLDELDSGDALMSVFKDRLNYVGNNNYRERLKGGQGVTLFVPSNEAWKNLNVERTLGNNVTLLRSILDLHLVPEKLSIYNILRRPSKEVATMSKDKYLFLNVISQGTNQTLTVEGGGVNATVRYSDIGATNGVIHIIDRVLGVPYDSVGRKVATDPEMNFTHNLGNIPYAIGKYANFNDKLNDPAQNYTFLVPRDAAWSLFKHQHPDLYKGLETTPGLANLILDKHLLEDHNYTMSELKNLLNNTYMLQTKYNGLNIKIVGDPKNSANAYKIVWNNEEVTVHRSDVRCTNGIIHIIDKVLIRPEDVNNIKINGAMKNFMSLPLLLFSVSLGTLVLYH